MIKGSSSISRLVDVFLVCTSTGLLIDRVRGAARCVCLCFLSAAQRWWVVELGSVRVSLACVSVVTNDVLPSCDGKRASDTHGALS